jgi:hypothetical protein
MIQVYIPFVKTIGEQGLQRDLVTVELGKILFNVTHSGYIKSDGSSDNDSPNIFNFAEKVIKKDSKD